MTQDCSRAREIFDKFVGPLSVVREPFVARMVDGDILFAAFDDDGRPTSLALDAEAFDSMVQGHADDTADELDQLAILGSWETLGEECVRRLTYI